MLQQGPILAGTFGTVIQDKKLQRLGLKNELIGLGLCLSSGFLFGLIYGSVDHWKDPSQFWLTNEMMSRFVEVECFVVIFSVPILSVPIFRVVLEVGNFKRAFKDRINLQNKNR